MKEERGLPLNYQKKNVNQNQESRLEEYQTPNNIPNYLNNQIKNSLHENPSDHSESHFYPLDFNKKQPQRTQNLKPSFLNPGQSQSSKGTSIQNFPSLYQSQGSLDSKPQALSTANSLSKRQAPLVCNLSTAESIPLRAGRSAGLEEPLGPGAPQTLDCQKKPRLLGDFHRTASGTGYLPNQGGKIGGLSRQLSHTGSFSKANIPQFGNASQVEKLHRIKRLSSNFSQFSSASARQSFDLEVIPQSYAENYEHLDFKDSLALSQGQDKSLLSHKSAQVDSFEEMGMIQPLNNKDLIENTSKYQFSNSPEEPLTKGSTGFKAEITGNQIFPKNSNKASKKLRSAQPMLEKSKYMGSGTEKSKDHSNTLQNQAREPVPHSRPPSRVLSSIQSIESPQPRAQGNQPSSGGPPASSQLPSHVLSSDVLPNPNTYSVYVLNKKTTISENQYRVQIEGDSKIRNSVSLKNENFRFNLSLCQSYYRRRVFLSSSSNNSQTGPCQPITPESLEALASRLPAYPEEFASPASQTGENQLRDNKDPRQESASLQGGDPQLPAGLLKVQSNIFFSWTLTQIGNFLSSLGNMDFIGYCPEDRCYWVLYCSNEGARQAERELSRTVIGGIPISAQVGDLSAETLASCSESMLWVNKRYSDKNGGLPRKVNPLSRTLHITVRHEEDIQVVRESELLDEISALQGAIRIKRESSKRQKNMWFAEFSTVKEALSVLINEHNRPCFNGYLRVSFTKTI